MKNISEELHKRFHERIGISDKHSLFPSPFVYIPRAVEKDLAIIIIPIPTYFPHLCVGIIDADLIDKKTNFPNLALMKLSSHHMKQNHSVTLLDSYTNLQDFDKVYIAKVFYFF